MASKDYSGLKKAELITVARRIKAPATMSMTKNEIIKAIRKADRRISSAKAKPASKAKAKAKPVKKRETKAKPSKKAKAAKTAPVKKAKAKTKARPAKAAKTEAVTKTKVKAKVVKKKVKTKGISGSAVKKNKSVVSKPAKPSTPAKKKAVSAKKAVNKPAKKVSRPAVVKERPPKPVSKKRAVTKAKKTVIKPVKKASRPSVIAEPAPKPAIKKKSRSGWDIPMDGGKFFVADERGDSPSEEEARLPESYGENRLVALPKDPRSLFVYWEVLETSSEEALRSLGKSWEQVKWTLRIYDVTSLRGVEEAYHNFLEVTVDPEAAKRYLEVEGDGREYIIELGLRDDDKRFVPVCLSNRVQTPRAALPPGNEDFPDKQAQKLYALSGETYPGSVLSEETASLGVSGFGSSEQSPAIREKQDYSLWVNCELTVYGAATPGSTLTLQGQEVNLRSDGAFSVKFHLPDGVQDIQVCGTSIDGVDCKEISLSVSRSSRIVR